MRQPSKQRLEFQTQAATVQQEASRLILFTTELFGQVFATGAWPQQAADASVTLAERGAAVADAWRRLRPTRTLEPVWQELCTQFDVLAQLFAKLSALENLSDSGLVEKTRSLQSAFTEQLERMNTLETSMLESEEMLRDRAQLGLEDE